MSARELSFDLNGRQLQALCWGDNGATPVLAVHGWMDNAESFAVLAPLLRGCQVVAPDLAGHGRSDHRGPDGEYNLWSDLPDLLAVADAMGWSRFCLLGHSRGALMSRLLAAAVPERVSAMMCLDAFSPQLHEGEAFPGQLADYLRDRLRLQDRKIGRFDSVEDAVAVRVEKGLPAEVAEPLVRRNLEACAGGWRWTMDARLRGASAMKLSLSQDAAVNTRLTMPVMVLLGEHGYGAFLREHLPELPMLTVETLPGGHHFHMEQSAQGVAERLLALLAPMPEVSCAP